MSRLSNWELLEIVYLKESYNPKASQAAQIEIDKRELTPDEIKVARRTVLDREMERQRDLNLDDLLESKADEVGKKTLDILHPFKNNNTANIIRAICFYLLLLIGYQVYTNFFYLKYLLNSGIYDPATSLEPIILIVLLSVSVVLLWNQIRLGWVLFTTYLVYLFIGILMTLFFTVKSVIQKSEILDQPAMEFTTGNIIHFVITTGLLFYMNSGRIRSYFHISVNTQISVLIGAFLFCVLLIQSFF